jgi:trigger factor
LNNINAPALLGGGLFDRSVLRINTGRLEAVFLLNFPFLSITTDIAMSSADTEVETKEGAETAAEEKYKLHLEIQVTKPSACERHILVTLPREDVDRYSDDSFKELLPKAEIPGFRAGKAPRKLVEKQFRDRIQEQVKGKLVMDAMAQISEEHDFSAISEPNFDFDAIQIPEEGPFKFEFTMEVRPEFDMPQWKGLSLEKPTHEYTKVDIDRNLSKLLAKYGTLIPTDEAAQADDYITVNATFSQDGKTLTTLNEESIQIRKILSFADGKIEDFDKFMIGAKAGDKKSTVIVISDNAEQETLRGQTVNVDFEVLDVKRMELPVLNHQFLDRIGGFEDEDELRDEVRKELERQLDYHQRRELRKQITRQLTASANWSLPPHLLKKQFKRELDRMVMELQSAGFDNDTINSHANQLRQNSLRQTEMLLKEHFILERIAEENKFEAEPDDYDKEIRLIAQQSGESARRVRARMEKKGQLDTLRNQIVEGKVIDLITENATIKDVPLVLPLNETTAVNFAVSHVETSSIPEAKPGGEEKQIPGMPEKRKEQA